MGIRLSLDQIRVPAILSECKLNRETKVFEGFDPKNIIRIQGFEIVQRYYENELVTITKICKRTSNYFIIKKYLIILKREKCSTTKQSLNNTNWEIPFDVFNYIAFSKTVGL